MMTATVLIGIGTIVSALVGPISAVLITLWLERRRRTREQQTTLLRVLLTTRVSVQDPSFSWAINAIPLEFATQPKVLEAHSGYLTATRYQPTPENADAHWRDVSRKLAVLIGEIMRSVGYRSATVDKLESYASQASVESQMLVQAAGKAIVRLSLCAERTAATSEAMLSIMQANNASSNTQTFLQPQAPAAEAA